MNHHTMMRKEIKLPEDEIEHGEECDCDDCVCERAEAWNDARMDTYD